MWPMCRCQICFLRPLKDYDALMSNDLALSRYRILESENDTEAGLCRVRVARTQRPNISAAALFDPAVDLALVTKHMVLFTPGEAETRCKLEDKEDCELVFAMAKARAFSGTGVHYYDADASVEEIDCLQRMGPELMHLQA